MSTAMNTAITARNAGAHAPLDHDLAADLHQALTLVEDWLLHASPDTLDELADFAYGPAHHAHDSHDHLRWIIDLLGEAAARLRPAPLPAPPEPAADEPTAPGPATADPATAERGPGR